MKITTKFKVGDIVQKKYDTEGKDIMILQEIMTIVTDTCYVGTQVFYLCRALVLTKEYEKLYDKSRGFTWNVNPGVHQDDNSIGWKKWREDEFIPAKSEYMKQIIK